jgi:hypothetical protein
VTCPNGSVSTGNQIQLSVVVEKGRITSGQGFGLSFSIFNPTTFVGVKQGFPTQGHVNPRSYDLKAIQTGDSLCNASIPTTVNITGLYGTNVQINIVAANGERGIFGRNFACT